MEEKTKLIVHRVVWLAILLILILIAIFSTLFESDLKLVDKKCYVDYNRSTNTSTCKMELTFNKSYCNGYVEIKFYDSSEKLLSTEQSYFSSIGETAEKTINVTGKVDKFEVVSCDMTFLSNSSDVLNFCYALIPICFILFINTLFYVYKEYNVNGKTVSVYSGFYHKTLRVNGEKYDEHNTIISYQPIILRTVLDDGTELEATISLMNRVAFKVNDKLCTH